MNNIILLGLVSFFTDVSSEIIAPILPMFITALGGAGLVVGLIGGLGDSIASFLKVFSGYWSDKVGKRKPFVFSGYSTSAIAKLFFPLATGWYHILILRPLERISKGLRDAPRDAIIADSVKKEKRGRGFGIHRAMDTSGAVIGSILAFVFIYFFELSFVTVFLIAAVIAFVALIPIIPVREKKIKKEKKLTLKISLRGSSKQLRSFIIIATIFALGNFSYMFFILRAGQSFSAELAILIPIALYILFNIVYAIFSIPAGVLSDRIGRKNVLLIGYLLFLIMCLGFALLQSLSYLVILFILYGVVYSLVVGTERAFVSDLSFKGLRGTGLGTFHTATGIAALPSSLIAGALWQFINPAATFIYGAVMVFIAFILLLSFRY